MYKMLLLSLGLLSLISVSLQRTYSRVPLKELQKRARGGDKIAEALAKAVGYGHTLRAVLWFLIGITSAGFFVMVSQTAPIWFAVTASTVLVWLGFVWLPAARISRLSEKLAALLAPLFTQIAATLHPLIDNVTRFIRKHRPLNVHTGLYDRLDLLDLLERQQVQADNRVEAAELEIAKNALSFGDLTVGQCMMPRRKVTTVSINDALGPIIMDELHASGHSRFPVYDGSQDNVVGTLYLHDLIRAKHGGTVKSLMREEAYYLNEDQSLYDALQAVLKTHRHLFVVVNKFEDFVGVISSEDIFETIIGKPIFDEFDQYDNLRAVAARDAKEEQVRHEQELEQKADEVAEEVQEAQEQLAEEEGVIETHEEPAEETHEHRDAESTEHHHSQEPEHLPKEDE